MFNIQVLEDKDLGYGVDARRLWEALESKRQFGNWITDKLQAVGAVEGEDFYTFNKIVNRKNARGASKVNEYTLSLRIAKKISMMEATKVGDKVRDYFLECEEKLYSVQQKALPQNYKEAVKALLEEIEARELVEERNRAIEQSENTYTATQIAKDLGFSSAKKLNEFLHDKGIIYKQGRTWLPYAKYQGYMSIKEVIDKDTNKSYVTSRFTLQGKEAIIKLLKKDVIDVDFSNKKAPRKGKK